MRLGVTDTPDMAGGCVNQHKICGGQLANIYPKLQTHVPFDPASLQLSLYLNDKLKDMQNAICNPGSCK